jgi:hypothetical protein
MTTITAITVNTMIPRVKGLRPKISFLEGSVESVSEVEVDGVSGFGISPEIESETPKGDEDVFVSPSLIILDQSSSPVDLKSLPVLPKSPKPVEGVEAVEDEVVEAEAVEDPVPKDPESTLEKSRFDKSAVNFDFSIYYCIGWIIFIKFIKITIY